MTGSSIHEHHLNDTDRGGWHLWSDTPSVELYPASFFRDPYRADLRHSSGFGFRNEVRGLL